MEVDSNDDPPKRRKLPLDRVSPERDSDGAYVDDDMDPDCADVLETWLADTVDSLGSSAAAVDEPDPYHGWLDDEAEKILAYAGLDATAGRVTARKLTRGLLKYLRHRLACERDALPDSRRQVFEGAEDEDEAALIDESRRYGGI